MPGVPPGLNIDTCINKLVLSNVFGMGYVTSFWVLCDTLSQCFISGESVYMLHYLNFYSFESSGYVLHDKCFIFG